MRVTIKIDCNNAAFDGQPHEELHRILTNLANRILHTGEVDDAAVMDINGNDCGSVRVSR